MTCTCAVSWVSCTGLGHNGSPRPNGSLFRSLESECHHCHKQLRRIRSWLRWPRKAQGAGTAHGAWRSVLCLRAELQGRWACEEPADKGGEDCGGRADALSTMVATQLGGGRWRGARHSARVALCLAAAVMAVAGGAIGVGRSVWPRLFTHDAQARPVAWCSRWVHHSDYDC